MKPIDTATPVAAPSRRQVQRAHLLFEEADCQMQIFGEAMNTAAAVRPASPDVGTECRQTSSRLGELERVAEGEILAAHARLQRAQAQAAKAAVSDTRLRGLHQQLYGTALASHPQSNMGADDNIVDVQARVVPVNTSS